eukprot:71166-Prymnesium_polylepis.1
MGADHPARRLRVAIRGALGSVAAGGGRGGVAKLQGSTFTAAAFALSLSFLIVRGDYRGTWLPNILRGRHTATTY